MIDLHLHLDGSLTAEEILQLAAHSKTPLPYQDATTLLPLLQVQPDCRDLGEYLEKFDLPLQVLQTEEAISFSVYFLLRRLASQGLLYAEIRFAPQLHLRRGLGQQQVVAAAVDGLQRGIAEFGMPAQLILCCMRGDCNLQDNITTIDSAKAFLNKGVCAVDLAGNEAAYPTKDFDSVFAIARQMDIPIIIHAGEAAGPKSITQALEMGARRIGHGIHAAEDPVLMERLSRQNIPLELCFTSNLQTKAVSCIEDYPLLLFLRKGIPITANTDNMTVSGTDLRQEYKLLRAHLGLSESMLQAIACNAAAAAFLPPESIEVLQAKITKRFVNWLNP